jgi:hypothetical protein
MISVLTGINLFRISGDSESTALRIEKDESKPKAYWALRPLRTVPDSRTGKQNPCRP